MWRIRMYKMHKDNGKRTYSRSVGCIYWWSFIFFLIQRLLSGHNFLSFRDLVSSLLWFDFSYLKQDFHIALFTLNCHVYLWHLIWQDTTWQRVSFSRDETGVLKVTFSPLSFSSCCLSSPFSTCRWDSSSS